MSNTKVSSRVVTGPEPRERVIRWTVERRSAYKVTQLGSPSDVFDLPGKPSYLTYDCLSKNLYSLVFSDRSGGTRGFLDWCRAHLDKRNLPRIMVFGDGWRRELMDASRSARQQQNDAEQESKPGCLEYLERFGKEGEPAERAAALYAWASGLKQTFWLIIRDLEKLGQTQAENAATALTLFAERSRAATKKLRVLVASTNPQLFAETAERSGFLQLCEQYRLPFLNKEEIGQLATDSTGNDRPKLELSEDALEDVTDITGGQPLLVQKMLQRLREIPRASAQTEFTPEEVSRVFRELRRSPPPVVRLWRLELQQLLQQRSELIENLREYVAGKSIGESSFPPPSVERPLMIAGWLAMNRNGRWGIASKLHGHFASQVLEKV